MDKPVFELYRRGEHIKIYSNGFVTIDKDNNLSTSVNLMINRLLEFEEYIYNKYNTTNWTVEELSSYMSDKSSMVHNKEQTKMTREEAIRKIKNIYGNHFQDAEKAIAVYEALGLLKFDEPKEELYWTVAGCHVSLSALHALIAKDGYQIVKLGKFTTIGMKNGTCIQGELDVINQS